MGYRCVLFFQILVQGYEVFYPQFNHQLAAALNKLGVTCIVLPLTGSMSPSAHQGFSLTIQLQNLFC